MTDSQTTTATLTRHDWLSFLQDQGAVVHNDVVTGFDNSPANFSHAALTLCDVSSKGIMKVCGEEAQTFLQNQFCNDVREVNDSTSQLNGYCTPKGRLLAFFRLWHNNDCYYINLPRERLAATLKRLQMFVLMSKVNLTDLGENVVTIGLAGKEANSVLQQHFSSTSINMPTQVNACAQVNDITLIQVPGTTPRYEISGPISSVIELWQQLSSKAALADERVWQDMDIQAGIPQVVDNTAEAFVPQMVNLELINALSFKKGCYPGQEIVARTHYLGKQKRRMYLAHIDTTTLPAAGDSIVVESDSNGQSAGTVVNAAPAADGGTDLLAVLQIAQATTAELVLASQQNSRLILKDLPYSVEVEDSAK